jgi:deoxyribose-phosphate aldolase
VTGAELDQLVAEIGEAVLARVQGKGGKAEGLGIPDLVCPGCTQRCVQTCHAKTRQIVSCGADRVSASAKVTQVDSALAGMIDHTLLKPDATKPEILKVCAEARKYGFASVCVNPYWVPVVAAELAGSPVKVCTVIGFPLGANTTEVKVRETEVALTAGAQEIDMVMNVGALRSGDAETVKLDIAAVAAVSHRAGAIVKVILETAYLDDNQKATACALAKMAKADFVKTSTGFGPSGATAHDIALMRSIVGPDMGVKASGGVRTLADVQQMKAAGATRIGASASVKIVSAQDGGPPSAGY